MHRPRLLVISHVLPFPGAAGQQQRVRLKLAALRRHFHVTFLTTAHIRDTDHIHKKLLDHCDEVILLPALYTARRLSRVWHRTIGLSYTLVTGLKFSNYMISREFAPSRIKRKLSSRTFECVLFEYWHAANSVALFRSQGIPAVLDMHNILWQSYQRQLTAQNHLPHWWRRRAVARYQRAEEDAWTKFDALIAINAAERDYVATTVCLDGKALFYAPMGADLSQWPYSWSPVSPPRICYYGGLGSAHNQQDALICHREIMPSIWEHFPDAELWLVGSNPPTFLRELAINDARVTVTGFVPQVQDVLRTMSLVLCPWTGTYGFRSRLVEVMALGIPVVTTPDAVHGMEFRVGHEVLLGNNNEELASRSLGALNNRRAAERQSQAARSKVGTLYSFSGSYGRLASELTEWLNQDKQRERFPTQIIDRSRV